jgi:DNA-binding beta-propeller fold protein YncE
MRLLLPLFSSLLLSLSLGDAYATEPSLISIIKGYNNSDGLINSPYGVTIDKSNRIIIADNINNRVQVFDSKGNFLFKFGSAGNIDGTFDHPSGVTVNDKGEILVNDFHNYRVQVFDSKGNFLFKFSVKQEDTYATYPLGIALDSNGRIIVTDVYNNRVLIFDSKGNTILKFGKEGSNDGEFLYPAGVAVDSKDRIYVADVRNNRVQVFDSKGNFLFKFGKEGSNDGEFSFPNGVAVDSKDRIYVADTFNHRVQVFDSKGNFLFKFGKEGSNDGEFSFPTLLYVRDGILAVADTFNHRVQVFRIDDYYDDDERIHILILEAGKSSDLTVDLGDTIKAVVRSTAKGDAIFTWYDSSGSVLRSIAKSITDGEAEDELVAEVPGSIRLEVVLDDGRERLGTTIVVIPEFPIPVYMLIVALALSPLILYARLEKTKFKSLL